MMKILYFEDEEAIKIGREYLKMQIIYNTNTHPTDESLDKYFEKMKLDPKYEFLLSVYLLEFYHGIKSENDILTYKTAIDTIMSLGSEDFLDKSTKSVFRYYASKSNDPEIRKKYDEWFNSADHKEFIKYITKAGVVVNIMDIAHLMFVKQLCDIALGYDNIDKKVLESIRSSTIDRLSDCEDSENELGFYTD